MVTESTIHLEVLTSCDTNFELIFCSRICNNFPVVNSACETNISCNTPENIILFFQKNMGIVLTDNKASSKK